MCCVFNSSWESVVYGRRVCENVKIKGRRMSEVRGKGFVYELPTGPTRAGGDQGWGGVLRLGLQPYLKLAIQP